MRTSGASSGQLGAEVAILIRLGVHVQRVARAAQDHKNVQLDLTDAQFRVSSILR